MRQMLLFPLLPLLLLIVFLIVSLEGAVFKVDVRHPSANQKQALDKWRQRIRHVGFAGRPKGTMLSKQQQLAAMKAGTPLGGRQSNDESTEIEDLDITYDPYFYRVWLNPQGTIKLGIPPQDFIVAFSVRSPDTFVAHHGAVKWDNFITFDETKSYTYSSDASPFRDSLFAHTKVDLCETHNSGVIGKDLITLGDIILPLKFGLVDNVTVQDCMDWRESEIEGMFGLALSPSVNGLPSTLEQIAPILDEPAFSVLTTVSESDEPEYHLKIGFTQIHDHCLPEAYTFFPSTSADIEAGQKDGYHTRLFSVELRYANGSFSRWNLPAKMDLEFTKLVNDDVWDLNPYIFGDLNTVDEVNRELGGEKTWWSQYAQYIPCNTTKMPNLVFKMGNATHQSNWVIKPEEYVLQDWYYEDKCQSLLQYHPWFGAWTSLEYHNKLCFAVKFGAGGNQIGLAHPKKKGGKH